MVMQAHTISERVHDINLTNLSAETIGKVTDYTYMNLHVYTSFPLICVFVLHGYHKHGKATRILQNQICDVLKQEAQLSPRDRAMRRVN